MYPPKRKRVATTVVLIMLTAGIAAAAEANFSSHVDQEGNIERPQHYRPEWVHLGSWIVPAKDAPGAGFHDVYTEPASLRHYRKTGSFPDGATLVKEIRTVQSKELSTGQASWAGEPVMWFVMIKDAKGRFADHPNWGNGWGWALFKSDAPEKNVSANFEKDCIGCHVPAQKTDWVYIEGYPTLR